MMAGTPPQGRPGPGPRPGERIPAGEAAAIELMVAKAITRVEGAHRREGFARRDAHVKSHGLARATFEVLPADLGAIDPWFRRGLFASPRAFPAWVRFSNASDKARSDRGRDVHGIAIKLMGIDGPGALGRPVSTHDFLLIDSPRFVVADAVGFAKFFGARKQGVLEFLRAALRGVSMATAARTPVRTYFSATPYLFVDEPVKFRLRPPAGEPAPATRARGESFLYEALEARLLREEVVFDFQVQRRTRPASMPVEDATVTWNEAAAPFVTIARLRIPTQTLVDGSRESFGEQLSFDPWNALADHAPLGGINRARRAVYQAVSARRHALNDAARSEPPPSTVTEYGDAPLLAPSVHQRTSQHALAFAVPLRDGAAPCLRYLLAKHDLKTPPLHKRRAQTLRCDRHHGDPSGDPCLGDSQTAVRLPLERLTTLHVGRLLCCPATREGEPDWLLLSFNVDGEPAAFMRELVAGCGEGLRALLAIAADAPPEPDDDALGAYLWSKREPAAAFYRGHPDRSVARIQAEATLREQIEEFLDSQAPQAGWATLSATELRGRIRRHVFEELSREWRKQPPPLPNPTFYRNVKLAGAGLAALVLASCVWLGLPAVGLWSAVGLLGALGYHALKRSLDRHDRRDSNLSPTHVRKPLVAEGPAPVMNWITHVVDTKPGPLRRRLLATIFFAVALLADKAELKGTLGGIPSIHFARWIYLDGGRRLVFFSNYDATWESYLDDFIYEAGYWLTAVWSNTARFPRTRAIFADGARDEPAFKEWTRHHQIDTQLWYCAYPALSVPNVNQNSKLRMGLYGEMNEREAAAWLRLLGRA